MSRCVVDPYANPTAIFARNGSMVVTFQNAPDPALVYDLNRLPPHRAHNPSQKEWQIAASAVDAALRAVNELYRNVRVEPLGPSAGEWRLIQPGTAADRVLRRGLGS